MKIPEDNPHKKRAEQMLKYGKKLIRERAKPSRPTPPGKK